MVVRLRGQFDESQPLRQGRLGSLRGSTLRRCATVQFRPPLPYLDRPAIYDSAVQRCDGWPRFNFRHFDESESARQATSPVGHQFKFANRPKRLEKRADCLWCRTGIQVTHKDVLHKISLVLRTSYARPIWHGRVPPSIISRIRPTSALPRATSSGLPL